MKIKLKGMSTAVLFLVVLIAANTSYARDTFDGSANLTCATFEVVGCLEADQCTSGQARKFDLPEFMTLDFKKKSIHVTYEGGEMEADSPISNHQKSGTQLILQGIEEGVGWSMSIHRDTGKMSIASVGHELTFILFGACKVD